MATTLDAQKSMAQNFLDLCRQQVGMGEDYRVRIMSSALYHQMMGKYKGDVVQGIIERAEREIAQTVLKGELAVQYRGLREVYWQQRNFGWPYYDQIQKSLVEEGLEVVREAIKNLYPSLYNLFMSQLGESGFRKLYLSSVYDVDKKLLDEWGEIIIYKADGRKIIMGEKRNVC